MAVSEQTPVSTYTGNGSTTVFAYNWKVLDEDDIAVYVDDTLQTITTHYTVSGVGEANGGNVTFGVAPTDGSTVSLRRDMVLERTTDYAEGGNLAADTLDADIDRVVMMIQNLDANTLTTFTGNDSIDFTDSYGLLALYFKSHTANPSSTGVLRLANVDAVGWRKYQNDGDNLLLPQTTNDELLNYNGYELVNISSVQTLTNKTLASPTFTGTVQVSGNNVWHAGNDGAGSGLDADLLDGVQGSGYSLSGHTHTLDSGSNVTITSVQTDHVLKWNGSAWINSTVPYDLSGSSITTLSDVETALTPATGSALVYDNSSPMQLTTFDVASRNESLQWVQVTDNDPAPQMKFYGSGTINSIESICVSGSTELTAKIGTTYAGSPAAVTITGVGGVAVGTSSTTHTCTANNTFSSGDYLYIEFDNSSTPRNILLMVRITDDV